MFSAPDYGTLAATPTGLPLAELFWQTTSTGGGAFGLVFLVRMALGPCVIRSQLSESQNIMSRETPPDHIRYWASVLGLCP